MASCTKSSYQTCYYLLLGCYQCIYNAVIVSVGATSEWTIHSRPGQSHLSVGEECPREGLAHGYQSWYGQIFTTCCSTFVYSLIPRPSVTLSLMLHTKVANIRAGGWGQGYIYYYSFQYLYPSKYMHFWASTGRE